MCPPSNYATDTYAKLNALCNKGIYAAYVNCWRFYFTTFIGLFDFGIRLKFSSRSTIITSIMSTVRFIPNVVLHSMWPYNIFTQTGLSGFLSVTVTSHYVINNVFVEMISGDNINPLNFYFSPVTYSFMLWKLLNWDLKYPSKLKSR